MNTNDKFMSCIGLSTLLISTIIIGAMTNGWALSVLWKWFIVPVFGLPILSLVQAIGVGMVVTFLTKHSIDTEKEGQKGIPTIIGESLARVIFVPFLTVAIGYIVFLFL